ncbi:MAG: PorV/PorQ family protein [Paludibacteraceae bacterium]|nr:PorV/PorQ family protein [Paludibacteraceae bacterium]
MKFSRYIVRLAVLVALLMPVQTMRGQYVGSGTSTFAFLDLPVSSRQNALGGENISIRDGELSSAFANPALLGSLTHNILQLGYAYYGTNHFGSAMYGYAFGNQGAQMSRGDIKAPDASALPKNGTFSGTPNNFIAVGVHYLDYGKMPYAEDNGQLTGISFGARDIMIEAAYARQLSEMFTVGVALKPIFSFYESYSSVALGADIGGHFQLKDSTLQIGLALKNIGWQLKGFYSDESGQRLEMLPINLELGINYRVAHAPLRFSLTVHNIQTWDLGYSRLNETELPVKDVGWFDMMMRHTIWAIDIVPRSEKFYLTLSYNHRRRMEFALQDQRSLAGFAIGAGLRIKMLRLGFAMSQMSKQNFTYQVSLAMDVNSLMK